MLVECSNCGAPLRVEDEAKRYVECGYCNKTTRLQKLKTLEQQTPPQWSPPPTWMSARTSTQLNYTGTQVKAVSAGVMIAIVGVVLSSVAGIVAMIVAMGAVSWGVAEAVDGDSPELPDAPAWDGTAPFMCAGHEHVTVSDVSADLPGATAILVTGHCSLTLEGSTITAGLPVSVTQHGHVTMRGGRLEGSPNAIEARDHANVALSGVEIVGEVIEDRHANVTR